MVPRPAVPPPGQPPRRRALTADERGFLAQCAALVRAAPGDTEREPAIATAVETARRYRKQGAGWDEIAGALGVPPAVLRDWRGSTGTASGAGKPPVGDRTPAAPAGRVRESYPSRPVVLVATGNAKVNGNDFPAEVAVVRRSLEPHGVQVVERCDIELAELRRELDSWRPVVLHLAAHADFGAVHLSLDGAAFAVLHADLHRAIRAAAWRPALAVLSCCDSAELARTLTRPDAGLGGGPAVGTAAGWDGAVTDAQARVFTSQLYRGLSTGRTVGRHFDDARLTVTACWPGQAAPRLFGNAAADLRAPLTRPGAGAAGVPGRADPAGRPGAGQGPGQAG